MQSVSETKLSSATAPVSVPGIIGEVEVPGEMNEEELRLRIEAQRIMDKKMKERCAEEGLDAKCKHFCLFIFLL